MNSSKIGTLFIISILALTSIGISYAGFMDVITITGTATTGSVDIDLEYVEGTWVWKDIQNHEKHIHKGMATPDDIDGDGQAGDDDAAHQQTPSWYTDPNMLLYSYATAYNDTENEDIIHLRWDNITPIEGMDNVFIVQLKLHYVGKIPARILKEGLQFDLGDADLIAIDGYTDVNWIQWLLSENYMHYRFVFADESGNPTEVEVDECAQLHYCDCFWLIIDCQIPQRHELQGLYGEMSFTINLIQFDESDCDDTYCSGSIGDYVWGDLNRDGVQDEGEPGVSGVTVTLLNENDIQIGQTITDASGLYLFNNLQPGLYKVQFELPQGYEFTIKDSAKGTPETDSDADQTTGKTDLINIECEESDNTWDAGLIDEGSVIDDSCISIKKTLYGSYTNPADGETSKSTDQIAIGAAFPTKFILEIYVTNCGTIDLKALKVVDFIGTKFTVSTGFSNTYVAWNEGEHKITWTIPKLNVGNTACIQIPIETVEMKTDTYAPMCGSVVCLDPESPNDGDVITSSVTWEQYEVEITNQPFGHSIKFNNFDEEGIRDGEYDVFEFTLSEDPGIFVIDVELKNGAGTTYLFVSKVGDIASGNDFTVEFSYKIDNGDGTYTYGFTVTNDNSGGKAALSHVAFRLPCFTSCDELVVNEGAKVTVFTTGCVDILTAKTEPIILHICCVENGIGTLQPSLPYATPEAQDSCTPES